MIAPVVVVVAVAVAAEEQSVVGIPVAEPDQDVELGQVEETQET